MSYNAKRYKQADKFPALDPRSDEMKPRDPHWNFFRKRRFEPKTQNQDDLIGAIEDNTITFGVGPAGSGKTYIASRMAAEALEQGDVKKIYLVRPAVGMGPTLGFLKGDLNDKIRHYMTPLINELTPCFTPGKFQELIDEGVIQFVAFEYIRGISLKNAFVILDECQNCTRRDFEAFLTRLGVGSKYVILGDNSLRQDGTYKQSDLPPQLQGAIDEMIRLVDDIEDIEVVQLEVVDCVRHPLVRRLLEAGL